VPLWPFAAGPIAICQRRKTKANEMARMPELILIQ
jgi:hypothetical protein